MKTPAPRRALRKSADRYHHGDLRQALLDATLAVVRTHGPEAVTLREVAGRAGVSGAAPYHHFRDKTELLAAAAATGFGLLQARLERVLEPDSPTTRETLVSIGVEWVRFALDEPGAFRLVFGAHVDALVKYEETKRAGRKVKALVRDAIASWGEGRAGVDAETVFRALWSQVHGIAWLSIEREFGASFSRTASLGLAREALERLLDGFERTATATRARPSR